MDKVIITTVQQLDQWLAENKSKIWAFDTETTDTLYDKLEIVGMSIFDSQRLCYINFANNPDRENLIVSLTKVFTSNLSGLIGHNLSFDLMVLSKYNIPWRHLKLFDTMVAFHLLHEEGEKALKKLAKEYLNIEEPVLFKDAIVDGYSSPKFIEYAMNDALYTGQLYSIFKPQLLEQDLQDLMRLEMEFIPCVVEMQVNGFLVDVKRALELKVELENKLADLLVILCTAAHCKYTMVQKLDGTLEIEPSINFNSGSQLGNLLFEHLNLPVGELTPSGKPATGREALEKLKGKHPIIEHLISYKKMQKLLSAFVEPLPSMVNKDGRVRSRFNVCGTVTGRLSSDSPNLQQLPKENKELGINVRDLFIASPGYVMLTCDYSGQELRVLTELTKDPTLVDSFKQGKDLHLATAKAVFGIDVPEEALYEKNKEMLDKYKKEYKKDRDKAKIVNFGIAYGKGPQGFATDFNITVDEATQIIEAYFKGMPTVRAAIEATKNEVKRDGYVRTMGGRRRRFTKIEKDGNTFYTNEMFRQAFNFLIQGYSADMMRQALVNTAKGRKPEWDLRMLATVHDEGVFECKSQYVTEVSKYLYTTFTTAVTFCIPIESEVGVGRNYGEAK